MQLKQHLQMLSYYLHRKKYEQTEIIIVLKVTRRADLIDVVTAVVVVSAGGIAEAEGGHREAVLLHAQVAALGESRVHARARERRGGNWRCTVGGQGAMSTSKQHFCTLSCTAAFTPQTE